MENTPAHCAAEHGNSDCIAMLLRHNSFQDVNIKNKVSAKNV